MKKKNKEVQSINCEQAVARFNDFMDNYLKGKTREELLKHLSECKDCMDRFEFEQLLKSKVHQLTTADDTAMKERIEKLMASL
jgi:Putative zinc-finger